MGGGECGGGDVGRRVWGGRDTVWGPRAPLLLIGLPNTIVSNLDVFSIQCDLLFSISFIGLTKKAINSFSIFMI